MKLYTVRTPHQSNYPNPIRLEVGQMVILGKLDDGPENWRNWRYCYTLDRQSEGWVPEQFIEKKGEHGVITEAYCAHELTVSGGEQVKFFRELNGWGWCQLNSTDEEGWIPMECLTEC
ncbi:SH3 domain-containing protein [Brevibacillus reuszeri]|uniref:SH3 domain-containing protein n=1 Tax=Brevibacillus reuszeri TaxID=54915 RepID=UPI002899012F|nr:SH3 domain-containing protein [Brevibacillus reuszeri]